MKRETAYKIAIEALMDKRMKNYAFAHHLAEWYPATENKNATKNYQRITQAIEILEAEKDHKQMAMFEAGAYWKQRAEGEQGCS